jgi:hypothetical protein
MSLGPWWSSFWLGIVPLALPIGTVVSAAYKHKFPKPKPIVTKTQSTLILIITKEQQEFHKTEFAALKSEIAELLKASAAHFQYAVIGSGAIFTWLMTGHKAEGGEPALPIGPFASLALWLPLILSGLIFSLSLAAYIRIFEMGQYLKTIENALGHPMLGWEKRFGELPPTIGPIFFWGWLFLIAGDWAVAVIFTR